MSETTTPPAATTPASLTSVLRIYASIAGGYATNVASAAIDRVRKWSVGAQLAVAVATLALPLWAYEGFAFLELETASSVDHKIAIAADDQRTDLSKMIEDQRADFAKSIAKTTPGKADFAEATAAIADLKSQLATLKAQVEKLAAKPTSRSSKNRPRR